MARSQTFNVLLNGVELDCEVLADGMTFRVGEKLLRQVHLDQRGDIPTITGSEIAPADFAAEAKARADRLKAQAGASLEAAKQAEKLA